MIAFVTMTPHLKGCRNFRSSPGGNGDEGSALDRAGSAVRATACRARHLRPRPLAPGALRGRVALPDGALAGPDVPARSALAARAALDLAPGSARSGPWRRHAAGGGRLPRGAAAPLRPAAQLALALGPGDAALPDALRRAAGAGVPHLLLPSLRPALREPLGDDGGERGRLLLGAHRADERAGGGAHVAWRLALRP